MSNETVSVCIRDAKEGSVWKVGGCMMVNSSRIRTLKRLKSDFIPNAQVML